MNQKHQEDLSHIRSMMERSSRFISLSGLSGVFAGIVALAGAMYVYLLFKQHGIEYFDGEQKIYSSDLIMELTFVALLILILALVFGIFFTLRKSKSANLPVWTNTTKKMLLHLAIPLFVGGVFCVALLYHQLFALIAPTTLLFYGLALILLSFSSSSSLCSASNLSISILAALFPIFSPLWLTVVILGVEYFDIIPSVKEILFKA